MSLLLTLILQILDAPLGTGITMFASSAQTTGSSMPTKCVFRSAVSATPLTALVLALAATLDTTSSMGHALLPQFNKCLTLDVLHGTGTSRFVCNAPTIGFSMPIKYVFLSLISATLSIALALVFLAILDTT